MLHDRIAVPLADVGRHGRLGITFGVRQGKTAIDDVYCEVPFKITRLLEPGTGGIAHLILMQCSAGLFVGDTVESHIVVRSGARVLITQQSATRVHPARDARYSVQNTRIQVEAGAELHMLLDPTIPFSGSRLRQSTMIDAEPGARVSYWESLMAGRIGRGESWQFDELSSELCFRMNGRPLFLDRFSLRPRLSAPTVPWEMGAASYLGTGLCFNEPTSDVAERLHALMPGAGVDSPSPGLVVARVVAMDGPAFHKSRASFAALSRE